MSVFEYLVLSTLFHGHTEQLRTSWGTILLVQVLYSSKEVLLHAVSVLPLRCRRSKSMLYCSEQVPRCAVSCDSAGALAKALLHSV